MNFAFFTNKPAPKRYTDSKEPAVKNIQLEKIPLPRFDGDIRSYPRFRRDFVELVMPTLNDKQASFMLRQCLDKSIVQYFNSCEENVYVLLERLDEKFGDPSKVTDVIINDIRNFKNNGISERLIDFINLIEAGYNDLKALSMEREMCNSNIVSIIESKMPKCLALEWYRQIHKSESRVDKMNKFPSLLEFLRVERKSLEYGLSDLRTASDLKQGRINVISSDSNSIADNCLIHNVNSHQTFECRKYLTMSLDEKYKLLRENFACYACLLPGHVAIDCSKRIPCQNNNCDRLHHHTLHHPVESVQNHSFSSINDANLCLLQIMAIPIKSRATEHLNVFWDSGATVSLVLKSKAIAHGFKGTPVTLCVTMIGGIERREDSYRYRVPLIDREGKIRTIVAYGIEIITNDISSINVYEVNKLFHGSNIPVVQRPSGTVDLLVGFDYAAWHPIKEQAVEHLLILSNIFGKCIGGCHPYVSECTGKKVIDVSVSHVSLSEFFTIESLGVECNPKCGSCRCGKCAIGGKNYTLKEERELALIKNNLTFVDDHWEVVYPWVKDPKCLPNNKWVVMKKLLQTEKRLYKDYNWRITYSKQMDNMVERNVARKLTPQEISNYQGPVHYISHHAVVKNGSHTTPVRIVFNSSANYHGHVLNEYWGKGPDAFINNLLGVLIRFRENYVGFFGDIKKMYNSVFTSELDQHCHRYLWRNMDTTIDPETYVITAVNMGDKPSGAIATIALKQTAEMAEQSYPEASAIVSGSTYVDDIIDSVDSIENAERLTRNIEHILKKGNFHMKEWTISGQQNNVCIDQSEEKVLGIFWNPYLDCFYFKVKLKYFKENEVDNVSTILSKRVALSIVNGIYDPLGLATPFTVRGKILLRKLTAIEPKIGWDEPIPDEFNADWSKFINCIPLMSRISFPRCVKPKNTTGNPTLITLSDASENAFGACCYIRWETNGEFKSNLLLSKSRVAPVKQLSIVRLELSAAVLATRIRNFAEQKTRFKFAQYIHLVDSEIVRAMIQKESYGFNTFVGTRVGEIQSHTNPSQWYWIKGDINTADIITRGEDPNNIGLNSDWQNGPKFMTKPIKYWPIHRECSITELPERNSVVLTSIIEINICPINVERFSKYVLLINVTARVLTLTHKHSLKTIFNSILAEQYIKAEQFWIIEAQKLIKNELSKGVTGEGKFKKLTPKINEDGIFVIGGRAERWIEISYNKKELPILPKDHRFSLLYCRHIHNILHLGVDSDIAKIRSVFWIIGLSNIVRRIRRNCVTCRRRYLKLSNQVMGKLPIERLKPAPAFFHSMVDLFGPYVIRGEVNKRSSKKVYGVIITDLLTRAVYIDVATDYSTDSFLMVFRRFVSIHGYPKIMFSDRGSQLSCASEELKLIACDFDWDRVESYGFDKGLIWKFSPSDSPWWNGCCESLIRSVKKAINQILKEQRVSYNELLTIFFESANLINERPIGVKTSQSQDFSYLCPNDMLLGRSTSRVPSGPFSTCKSNLKRFAFVQLLIDSFWKKWTRIYFPTLLMQHKWHHEKRNVTIGDIVIIQDNNAPRGQWKLGTVSKSVYGIDNKVRRIEIQYKNKDSADFVTIERAVQKIAVVLPVEEMT